MPQLKPFRPPIFAPDAPNAPANALLQSGRACVRSCRCELHEREGGTAVRPVRITQGFEDLEVIEVRRLDQLDGLSGSLHGSGEIPVLTLELGSLVGAVGHDHRRAQKVEVALRTHRVLHVVGEPDIGSALREANGLQVVPAAKAKPALQEAAGQAKTFLPVGDQRPAAEMSPRGMTADIETIAIAIECLGVSVDPGDGATDLIGHGAEIAVGLLD